MGIALRRMFNDVGDIKETLRDHGERLTAIELALAHRRRKRAVDAEMVAVQAARIDKLSDRLSRVERRLGIASEQ